MFTVTLNGKTHQVDYVRAIALREIGPVMETIRKMEAEKDYLPSGEALDKMVKWFCLFLGGQIKSDEIYQHYPADRLIYDIALGAVACQAATTEVLRAFPTQAAMKPQEKEAAL